MSSTSEYNARRIYEHLLQSETLVRQNNLRRALEIIGPDFDLIKDNPPAVPDDTYANLYYSLALNLADIHMGLQHFAIAERMAKECMAKFGDDTPELVISNCEDILANLYVRTERFADAEAAVTEHIRLVARARGELDPSLATKYHLLVVIYCALRRLDEAERPLRALEQIKQNVIRDGHQHLSDICDSFDSARDVLAVAKAGVLPAQASSRAPPPDSHRLSEQDCWQIFCGRHFALAVNAAVRLLGSDPSVRTIEVWLLSRLWMGEDARRAGEEALDLAPAGSSCRTIIEFTVGKLRFEDALRSLQSAEDECQIWFYAAMIALLNGEEARARDCLARVVEFKIDLPERRQASTELEALESLARDISDFDIAVQQEIQAAYHDFADYDWVESLHKAHELVVRGPVTPQLLIIQVAGYRALAQQELAASFASLAHRWLLHWPWHARMLDLIMGRVSIQVLLPLARSVVETCQLRYYAFVANRLFGRWQEAALHLREALNTGAVCDEAALAELDGMNIGGKLENINRQVRFLADHGELNMAERAARGGLAMAKPIPGLDGSEVGTLTGNLAAVLGMSGRLSESLPLFEEIISSASLGQANQLELSLNLGQLYLDQQMLPQARAWLERAWTIGETTAPGSRAKAALCNALGRLAQDIGDSAGAYHWFTAAAEQLSEDSPSIVRAIVTDNLGVALARSHRYQEALALHERAGGMMRSEGESHPSRIKILMNIAWTLRALGRPEEALQRLAEALQRCNFPESEAHPMTCSVLRQSAIFYFSSGKTEQALDVLIAASRVEDRQFGETMSLSSDELRMSYASEAIFGLSLLLSVARNVAGTEPRLEQVLDIVLRRKALVAHATAARRDVVIGGRYPSLRPLLEEMHALQNQIAILGLGLGSENQAPPSVRDVAAKRERLRQLETSLAKEIPELRIDKVLREVTAQRVLRSLPATWCIIEFVRAGICDFAAGAPSEDSVAPQHYFAFVIPSTRIEQLRLVDLGPATELDLAVGEFLADLGEYGTPRTIPSRDAVRDRLVRPLFSLLPPSGHVLIAPDGYLAQLPFEVLPAMGGTFLIDDHSFSYITTMRDVLRSSVAAASAPQSPDVVIADPEFGESCDGSESQGSGGFEPLPGTREEAKAVADLLGVVPWLGADASKTRLTRLVSPRILHIATHGFLAARSESGFASYRGRVRGLEGISLRLNMDDSLLRSGLALAGANIAHQGEHTRTNADDGLLTASDVMAMNLLGTQLVVLSACDTARGTRHPTEGPIGIRRAFQLAGARTVIASLWKLPDDQTALLMQGFYQRLHRGAPCFQALRAAQIELRNAFPSPFFWGAFVCFGDAGAIGGTEMMWGEGEESNRQAARLQEQAIEQWSLVLDHDPFASEALLRRGINYHNLHRYAEALADFDRALQLAPNLPELLFSRGFSYFAFGRPQQAISDFSRALELDAGYGRAYHRRGVCFLKLGDDEAALRDLSRAIELVPADPDIHYDRAGYFADRRMFKDALADYSEAIRLRPSFEVAYVNRATVLIELGALEEAIADLRTAVTLDPRDALAHLNLGSALAMDRKADEALKCWEAAAQWGTAEVIAAAREMAAQVSSKREEMRNSAEITISILSSDQ